MSRSPAPAVLGERYKPEDGMELAEEGGPELNPQLERLEGKAGPDLSLLNQICPTEPQPAAPGGGVCHFKGCWPGSWLIWSRGPCRSDQHQFANAFSLIFTHSRLFQNSLILKRRMPSRIGCRGKHPVGKPLKCTHSKHLYHSEMPLAQMVLQQVLSHHQGTDNPRVI